MPVLRDVAGAALWLLVCLVVAIGAAGIVSGVGGPPGSAARPELTYAGDLELRADLGASTQLIDDLSMDVAQLGEQGRLALTRITARDVASAQTAVDDGSAIAARVADLATQLEERAQAMPGDEPLAGLRYAPGLRAQRALIESAAGAAMGIEPTWQRFATAALAAERMATLLMEHDEQTGNAAKLGSAGKYAEALAALDTSDATMAEIERLHTAVKAATDTTVLTTWIERHTTYDRALRTLYQELVASKGRATAAVNAAYKAQQAALEQLPSDTKALTVVMSEIAQGGLQQTAVSIIEVEQRLEDIVDRLDAEA